MQPELTYTVEQFIAASPANQISYSKLSIFEKVDSVYMCTHNLLNDYTEEIKSDYETILMSDEEYAKYCYRPKLLAYDVYGDTELFFIILFVNNICNVKDFSSKRIKMIKNARLSSILSAIYNAEYPVILKNQNKIESLS